ncbi:MAG: hypothetical protein V7721_09315 [Porticoccaceae bacterium]
MTQKKFLRTLSWVAVFFMFSAIPQGNVKAYEIEMHYWLKFKLALNCGYKFDEARLIAMGDWGLDAEPNTQPIRLGGGDDSAKSKWHALPTINPEKFVAGAGSIKTRQGQLWKRAEKETNPTLRLIYFGQYLHYLEDKWAHWGYTTSIGHGHATFFSWLKIGDSPDRIHARPENFKDMIFDTLVNMAMFREHTGGVPHLNKCFSKAIPFDKSPSSDPGYPWMNPRVLQGLKKQSEQRFETYVAERTRLLKNAKKFKMADALLQLDEESGWEEKIINWLSGAVGQTIGQGYKDTKKNAGFIPIPTDENGKPTVDVSPSPKVTLEELAEHEKRNQKRIKIKKEIGFLPDPTDQIIYDPVNRILIGDYNLFNRGEVPAVVSVELTAYDLSRGSAESIAAIEYQLPEASENRLPFQISSELDLVGRPVVIVGTMSSENVIPDQSFYQSKAIVISESLPEPNLKVPLLAPESFQLLPGAKPDQWLSVVTMVNLGGPKSSYEATLDIFNQTFSGEISINPDDSRPIVTFILGSNDIDEAINGVMNFSVSGITVSNQEKFRYQFTHHLSK